MIKLNDIYEEKVIELDYKGDGVIKLNDTYVYVSGALKDELIVFEIIKINKKFGVGKLINIITPSIFRTAALNVLGSLSLNHLSFKGQLEHQEEITKTSFNKAFKKEVNVLKVVTDNNELNYRNKVTFHILESKEITLGLYKRFSKELIRVDNFILANSLSNKLLKIINESKIKIDFNTLKHIMIKNNDLDELLVTLVATKERFLGLDELILLISNFNGVVGITLNINKDGNKILGNRSILKYGKNHLTYKELLITDKSFMQVNFGVMELTFNLIKENIKGKNILDLYSGIGSIIYNVLDQSKKGIMVEVNPENIKLAKIIKNNNKIENLEIVEGLAEDYLSLLNIDTLILDPPRSGLDNSLTLNIKQAKIERLIYLSCNLQTLIKDLRLLSDSYEIIKVYPIKMFPSTNEFETLVILDKNNKY